MKYNLRFEEMCLYEVEAESEEEALKVPVPTFGRWRFELETNRFL